MFGMKTDNISNSTTASSRVTRIRIAHINDTHSHFEPSPLPLQIHTESGIKNAFSSVGGFARIHSRVQHWRKLSQQQQREFMLLHAGDCFQGSLYFSLFKGQANVELLNALSPDVMALGNHELDMGNDAFAAFCQQMNFPLLAGNWNLTRESKDKAFRFSEQSHVYSYREDRQCARWIVKKTLGEPVALFGLSIDKMADISAPDDDTPFEEAITVARKTVEAIKLSGVHNIILVSHLGYEGDKRLASEIDGIGLIVGGHSHVLQGDFEDIGHAFVDPYGVKINHTHIVQAGCHSMALGHCEVDFDSNGRVVAFTGYNELLIGRTLYRDAKETTELTGERARPFERLIESKPEFVQCAQHAEIVALLGQKFKPAVDALAEQALVNLSKPLKHMRIPHQIDNPTTGSQVAPLVAKAFYVAMRDDMRDANRSLEGHVPQFAIHNAGGVRASLYDGVVTKADIAGKILPFTVSVGCYTLLGKDVIAVLQGAVDNALSSTGTGSGSFPYCYGLRFELTDADVDGEQQRVSNVQILESQRWETLDEQRVYCGCSSAYTMTGREGYDAILNTQTHSYVSDKSMADCFIYYLQNIESKKSILAQLHHLIG
jgi:5'-nucleotidase